MRLTDVLLRNAKPGSKPRHFSDGSGLSLVIQPDGKRYWRFRYRLNGKPGLKSIGVYPNVGLKEARTLRDQYRQDVANGLKPGGQQRKGTDDAPENTFEAVANEWFATRLPNWSKGSSSMNRMRLDSYILPAFGTKSIATVGGPDLVAMLKPIQQEEKFETAHRVLTICGQVFNYGIATGRNEYNPAPATKTLLTKPTVKHMAALTKPADVGRLLRMLYAYEGSPAIMAALKMAPLIFVRPGELRTARWDDMTLDGTEPRWEYTVSKTRTPHIVPLATQAVEILRELRTHTGFQPFCFPGMRHNGRPMSENTLAVAMRTIGIAKTEQSVHGLRATARTLFDEQLGFPLPLIEHQLAHQVHGPLKRAYNRTTHLPERRAMMQKWADFLDGLRTKRSSTA